MSNAVRKYRNNAAIIVTDGDGRVLLCERADLPGVIQTVQGGVDKGESVEDAARRELQEELGLQEDQYELIEMLLNTYRYEWEQPVVQLEEDDYIGQEQTFFLAKVSPQVTFDLDVHHREFTRVWWGTPNELIHSVNEQKRPGIRAAIQAFKKRTPLKMSDV